MDTARHPRVWTAAIAVASFVAAGSAWAQEPAPPEATVQDPAPPPADPAPPPPPPAAVLPPPPAPLPLPPAPQPPAPKPSAPEPAPISSLDLGGRLYAMWRVTSRDDRPLNDFSIATARIEATWRPTRVLRAVIEVELSGLAEEEASSAMLRDANLRVAPMRALRLTVGQLKKPFSRVQLYGRAKLPLIRRGMVNDDLVEGLGFGGRDIGAQVDGRVGKRLRLGYAAGIFNGAGVNQAENDLDGSKDFAGRIEAEYGKVVSLGLNATHRTYDRTPAPLLAATALGLGADLELDLSGFHALAEVDTGANAAVEAQTQSIGSIVLLWTRWQLDRTWSLEPLLAGELLVPDLDEPGRVMRGTVGVNVILDDILRTMIDFDATGPFDLPVTPYRREKRLLVQLAFDG